MKIVTKRKVLQVEVTSIECDKCKQAFDSSDVIDMQDFMSAQDVGGYGSAWGDGNRWSVDLCGKCAVEVLGPYARQNQIR